MPGTVPYIGENSEGNGKQAPHCRSVVLTERHRQSVYTKNTWYFQVGVRSSKNKGRGPQGCWEAAAFYRVQKPLLTRCLQQGADAEEPAD